MTIRSDQLEAMLNALEGSAQPLDDMALVARFSEHRGRLADLQLTQEVLAALQAQDLIQVIPPTDIAPPLYAKLERKSRDGRWVSAEEFARFDWSSLRPGDFVEGVGPVSSPSRCQLLRAAMGAALAEAMSVAAGDHLVSLENHRLTP